VKLRARALCLVVGLALVSVWAGSHSARADRSRPFTPAKPPPSTQTQKSSKQRGVHPCDTPDPGFGVYRKWNHHLPIGGFIVPQRGGFTRDGGFDVMFHFHGHEAVRKEWVQVMEGAVLVGIDLGTGSGPYEETFRSQKAFENLVEDVEQAVAEETGRERVHVRKVGVSGWSAGYGALAGILRSDYGKRVVDAVVLLDSLHSGYRGGSLDEQKLAPFINFARLAARGRRFMFVSHSSIIPPGYASTTETANFLIHELGGSPLKAGSRRNDPMGLDLVSRFTKDSFHVRGYGGNDKMDHCAHIGLFRDVLSVHVRPRWQSPRGYR
jgi:hypothetical protein